MMTPLTTLVGGPAAAAAGVVWTVFALASWMAVAARLWIMIDRWIGLEGDTDTVNRWFARAVTAATVAWVVGFLASIVV